MKEKQFFTVDAKRAFRTKIRQWYAKHKRDLPWRATADPYRIWLSEIMLQQTTVATVQSYFDRFLKKFPTLNKLANANESDVLKLWEGLGYYSRARNIHKTARIITNELDGIFPHQLDELQKLPGIGRYTAGAIISFAYNKPAPIVEANTQRLYARLAGYAEDLTNSAGKKFLWSFAEELLPSREPGTFNQAIMELGSQVCTPREPACGRCPVARFCSAYRTDTVSQIPKPKSKPKITEVTHVCVAVKKQNKFLIHQYQPGMRWAGLWDFPRWEIEDKNTIKLLKKLKPIRSQSSSTSTSKLLFEETELYQEIFPAIEKEFKTKYNFQLEILSCVTTIKHAVTRYKISLTCFEGKYRSGRIGNNLHNCKWVCADQLNEYPLSTTARKIAQLLQ